ncbi:Tumor necrosis factor ligand superfamily member 14 [Liparis tanakae]|uniref:Tumor necrosis factor ligand superfamily member 14 n=1 Tax=Liparis tanakae TaxID=230148 RepID=A0A4Z2HXE9_9TELE|nr:Tumor necrosis factor ligand superfamily member 14 [Liparis tanakae]
MTEGELMVKGKGSRILTSSMSIWRERETVGMSNSGCPSVCVVDTYSIRPAVPPRPRPEGRHTGAVHTLLFLLLSVALCGMVLEACFIYRLYRPGPASSASSSQLLQGGQDVVHGKLILAWSMNASPLLYGMSYKNKSLVIQKEGYYHIYSKVSFLDNGVFDHSINRKTDRYPGASIPLLMSRRDSEASSHMQSNSYLAGVFHLYRDDALFVKVSQTSRIDRSKAYGNVFASDRAVQQPWWSQELRFPHPVQPHGSLQRENSTVTHRKLLHVFMRIDDSTSGSGKQMRELPNPCRERPLTHEREWVVDGLVCASELSFLDRCGGNNANPSKHTLDIMFLLSYNTAEFKYVFKHNSGEGEE